MLICVGDNKATALSICRRVGIITEQEEEEAESGPYGSGLTGREFDELPTHLQREACRTARCFARVEPTHKSRIVEYLQSLSDITAMVRFSSYACLGAKVQKTQMNEPSHLFFLSRLVMV